MDYLIELGFEGPGFVAVPNGVVDDERMSADALGVLVYLARLAGGRRAPVVRVSAIQRRFKFGDKRWRRIARELRNCGAISDNFGRTEDGRNIVRSLVVGWPKAGAEPVPPKTGGTGKTCAAQNRRHTGQNRREVAPKTGALKEDTEGARGAAASQLSGAARPGGVQKSSDGNRSEVARRRNEQARELGLPWRDETGVWQPAQPGAVYR